MIIPKKKLDGVLKTINEYHLRLKFTYEVESNNTLNFLNIGHEGEWKVNNQLIQKAVLYQFFLLPSGTT